MQSTWLDAYRGLSARGLRVPCAVPARIVVSGGDRLQFLQNFCTNDVARLAPGEGCEAFFLNAKGHVLLHALVSARERNVVLFPQGGNVEALIAHLDRYILRDDVDLAVVDTPYWFVLGRGEGSVRLPMARLAGITVGSGESAAYVQRYDMLHPLASIVESEISDESLQETLDQWGYSLAEDATTARAVLECLRIESGLPLGGVDYGEGTLPQELSRNAEAINFKKGCYLGQETVARIDALGHVNKQITGIHFPEGRTASVGLVVHAGDREVGRVTSLTYSPALEGHLGLAMVRREACAPGTTLTWEGGEATVVALPVAARQGV